MDDSRTSAESETMSLSNDEFEKEKIKMNKRGTGAIFCLTGSLLFAARYITAAIFMSNITSWDSELFAVGLEYQGLGLLALSIVSWISGIIYLVWAEIEERKQ